MRALLLCLLPQFVPVERPSVLLIVLDEIGAEQISCHPSAIADPPPTPTLSALAAEGFQFTNVWGAPVCSPSRAEFLTGRFPFRTGMGGIVGPGETFWLAQAEVTVAERLAARGYRTAMFGKWHLDKDHEGPCSQGFEAWMGSQGNLGNYWSWPRVDDTNATAATVTQTGEYATSAVTEAAIAWLDQNVDPCFALVAYNAAHKPAHCPPVELQSQCTGTSEEIDQYRGMVESVDTEIGRLLTAVDRATTTVIVVGDNGTPDKWTGVIGKSKGSCYRLGLEVPLILWGDAVDSARQWGVEDVGHVSVVDLYRTLLKLLPGPGDQGMQVLPLDSVSLYSLGAFASARAWNFAERFQPLGAPPGGPYDLLHRAVEDSAGYKLIERETGARELYDTAVDPDEEHDLLADGIDAGEQAILDSLDAILGGLGL